MNNKSFTEEITEFSKTFKNSFVKEIHAFDEINSTNIKAKEMAQKNEPEGTIVVSKIQKKGRGRFDREWKSPEGGLYFSIILRPECKPEKTTLLPLLSSLAVSETINECGISSRIKWPNDVLIENKKISGILLESESKNQNVDFVIVGIGINLNIDVSEVPNEFNATSVSNELGQNIDFYDFFKKILENFERYYLLFSNQKYHDIIKSWKEKTNSIGKKVKIITSTSEIIGEAIDMDLSGFLIVKTNSGELIKINSGDCFYI